MEPYKNHLATHQLIQLGNVVSWYRNQHLQEHDLTSSQGQALRFILLQQKDGASVSEIMEKLNLSQSTTSGIVQRLESKGLIRRSTDPSDGRKSRCISTELGRDMEKALICTAEECERLMREGMTEGEYRMFIRLLSIALSNMNDYRKTVDR